MSRAVTCTYHCSPCGRHFHSLAAFDAHRIGDFASNDPETRRRCASPLDLIDKDGELRLEALTQSGVCRLCEAPGGKRTIWTTRGAVERVRGLWESA